MPRGASTLASKVKQNVSRTFKGISRNVGRGWTKDDSRQLKQLVKENTPTRVMSVNMGRPISSIRYYAKKEGISLRSKSRAVSGMRQVTPKSTAASRKSLRASETRAQ